VYVGYTVSPLVDERGSRLGAILIFKDLTEIVALRDEVRQRDHLATLGEMTASIAHEIRNPLASMHTAAETLKEELGYDEDKEEYLNLILREVKRVNNLVSDFFSYVRPMTPELEPVPLHDLLDVLVFIEGAKMKKSGVRLSCRFDERKIFVTADRNLLQQALLNILLNAHQASPASGEIVVSTQFRSAGGSQSMVEVRVRDQGPGIRPETISKIFEPFFSTKTKGIGLGLPITERIVRAIGGRIEVDSTPDEGTTFSILLPVAEAEPGSPPQ
jgi:signal transduction histidine kinase